MAIFQAPIASQPTIQPDERPLDVDEVGQCVYRVQIAVYAYEHGIVRPGHSTPPPAR